MGWIRAEMALRVGTQWIEGSRSEHRRINEHKPPEDPRESPRGSLLVVDQFTRYDFCEGTSDEKDEQR